MSLKYLPIHFKQYLPILRSESNENALILRQNLVELPLKPALKTSFKDTPESDLHEASKTIRSFEDTPVVLNTQCVR